MWRTGFLMENKLDKQTKLERGLSILLTRILCGIVVFESLHAPPKRCPC